MSVAINIHCHQAADGALCLVNHDNWNNAPQGFRSAGIHPWHIDDNTAQKLDILNNWCRQGLLAAIGEAGLDRSIDTDIEQQKSVFAAQVTLAKQHRLPIIIHCVRAHSDFLQILRREPDVKMIFHGFSGNATTANQLLQHGAMLSFGHQLLSNSELQKTFTSIPNDCIFLETDTKSININDIYNFAAELKSVSADELKQIIYNNLIRIFGNKWATIG